MCLFSSWENKSSSARWNEVSEPAPAATQGIFCSGNKCEAKMGWEPSWAPALLAAEGKAQAKQEKSNFPALLIVLGIRGAAADPCKAVITCTPNTKQGNQLTKWNNLRNH